MSPGLDIHQRQAGRGEPKEADHVEFIDPSRSCASVRGFLHAASRRVKAGTRTLRGAARSSSRPKEVDPVKPGTSPSLGWLSDHESEGEPAAAAAGGRTGVVVPVLLRDRTRAWEPRAAPRIRKDATRGIRVLDSGHDYRPYHRRNRGAGRRPCESDDGVGASRWGCPDRDRACLGGANHASNRQHPSREADRGRLALGGP
jgi:hypothetical protein